MKIEKPLRLLGKLLLSIIALLLIYLIAALGLSRISLDGEAGASDDISIYIKTNGVHTDIVVPAKTALFDWTQSAKFSNIESKDTSYKYLAIGWGDKGFYLETPTWADLKFSVAFKAVTGLNTTALHATYYKNIKEGSSCRKIEISNDQYLRLIEYIDNYANKTASGNWVYIDTDANYRDSDAFYEAMGSYSMLHTCNTWANNALKYSGQKHSLWTPFDSGIFLNYK